MTQNYFLTFHILIRLKGNSIPVLSRGLGGTGIFSKSGRELNILVLPASNLKANGSGAEATSLNTLQKNRTLCVNRLIRCCGLRTSATRQKPQSAQSSGTIGGAAASVLRSINPRAANDRGRAESLREGRFILHGRRRVTEVVIMWIMVFER